MLLTLADPVLRLTTVSRLPPLVYFLFDGTDSMAIEDRLTPAERERLSAVVDNKPAGEETGVSRIDYVRSWLRRRDKNLLRRLQAKHDCRVEAFLFEGEHAGRLRRLEAAAGTDGDVDPERLAEQLTTSGRVTAIGAVLGELGQQYGASQLAGVVMVSDFAQNAGPVAVGERGAPAQQLGVPIFTVGVGASAAKDLAVDLQPPVKMKRAERSALRVKLTQAALDGTVVDVSVVASPATAAESGASGAAELVGERRVTLAAGVQYLDFAYTPRAAGRFRFTASVAPQIEEAVTGNNTSSRIVNVIDDYLRLLYVAFEPSWEWRFVKEVFHRDPLVGMRGFRTFLQSSHPLVRENNALFVPTHELPRRAFFANDVIFLEDMPRDMLTARFTDLMREFVGRFGGGLVVIAGPRFGPGQLADTPLAEMLPVVISRSSPLADQTPFRLQITAAGERAEFMRLGSSAAEHRQAWDNLGPLPWYYPATRIHPLATVLAEHPTDTCTDGSRQPLIAIRRYGRGQVVYLALNEMWRLRRHFGERYHRQFWSQLINHVGLSHALGADKRFVVRTDRQEYQVDDEVVLTIEAYDEQFEPLMEKQLQGGFLGAELIALDPAGSRSSRGTVPVTPLRPGEFEARLPVHSAGEYALRVADPITKVVSEVRFEVVSQSAERREAVRNVALQQQIARTSGGRAYELQDVDQLLDDLDLQPIEERLVHSQSLWSTPLWFIAVVGLMLSEWCCRKMLGLT
jgi:hypothetical protein